MDGWISLYRKFIKWQWYKDSNVKALFIHLLLIVNHKDEIWRDKVIKRGQVVTSRENLSKQTGLSEQQIRTCLTKLKKTNDIDIKTTNKYTLITIINYDKYQRQSEEVSTRKSTSKIDTISTNKKEGISTSKIDNESIENKGIKTIDIEVSTNKKEGISTSKIDTISTRKSTTNNNIYNNIKLNYTKLNLLFNYLLYKEKKFENLDEADRTEIIKKLKELEIYTTMINHLPSTMILESKIKYWTIMQIYLSPYRVYWNNINRLNFMFRFLKAKTYMSYENGDNEKKLEDFIAYFIKSLQGEIKHGN